MAFREFHLGAGGPHDPMVVIQVSNDGSSAPLGESTYRANLYETDVSGYGSSPLAALKDLREKLARLSSLVADAIGERVK
jgi:hypothetical protein